MAKSRLARETDAYIAAIQRGNRAALSPIQQSILSIKNTPSQKYDFSDVHAEIERTNPGIGSRIIDVLSRPLYGSASVANEVAKGLTGDPTVNNNLPMAFWEGLSGQKKTTYADVIDTALPEGWGEGGPNLGEALDKAGLRSAWDGVEAASNFTPAGIITKAAGGTGAHTRDIVKGVGGLAGDILLDPINLATGGASAVIKGARRGTKKATTPVPVETTDEAAQIAESNKVIDDAAVIAATQDPAEQRRIATILDPNNTYDDVLPLLSETEKASIHALTPHAHSRVHGRAGMPTIMPLNGFHNVDYKVAAAKFFGFSRVQPLPVENAPRASTEIPKLDSIDMGKLGESATHAAISILPKKATGQGALFGRSRASFLRNEVMPRWKTDIEARIAEGATPLIRATDGTEYALSTPHALEMLPPGAVEDMLFGATYARTRTNTNLYFSQVNAGMAEALRLDDLAIPLSERYARVSGAMLLAKHSSAKRNIPASAIDDAARVFVDNTEALRKAQFESAKAFAKKDLQDAGTMAQAKSANIVDTIADKSVSTSHAINAVNNVGADINAMAREIGASSNAASIAAQEAAKLVGKVAPEADTTAARTAAAVRNARNSQGFTPAASVKVEAAVNRMLPAVERDALAAAQSVGIDTLNISNKVDVRTQGVFQALMNPLRTRFSFGYGTGSFADTLRTGEAVADKFAHNYHAALNQYTKQFNREQANTAFSAVKRGHVPEDGLDAFLGMRQFVDHVFDTNDALLGAFWRSGEGIGEINRALKAKGLGQYSFINTGKGANEIADQWRQWDIKDPLDFLDKAHGALTHLSAKKAAGIEFSRLGSATPKPGSVKITSEPDSLLGNFIDKGRYYDRETAEMFSRLEHMLKQPRSFKDQKGAIASIVNNVVDPFLQLWKPFVTIVRPGHHVRNIIGDAFMTNMDGMLSLTSYKRAMQMMGAGGQLQKAGLEGLKQLEGGLKAGGDVMSTVRLKGRNVKLSYDNGYQLAVKHGLLQSFRRVEDFDEVSGKFVNGVMKSLPLRIAGLASEKSAELGRLAHFEKLMRSKGFTRQFNDLEAAAESAARRVRRFHPDSRGLTPFETKYMRRLIPFYSWIRQAFPVVVTTAIMKPGRVTVLPKITHNAAIAAGMDPDSMSDQFPTDKLYPSFVLDTISGPIGNYGYNLGSPQEGVLGDVLNGNPARNIASMLNPLIKTPVEFTTNHSLGTGAYIADKGEAVDQLLPGVNQVANISGYSPSGTVANLLSGIGELDPQRSMQRGEKEAFFNTSMLNFLTGLGIQDYNKPSYHKIAARELKTQ